MKNLYLLSVLLLFSFASFCQKITLAGKVTDESNKPVIGASIIAKGTTNGTITDFNGRFKITVEQGSTLKISYVGYPDYEMTYSESIENLEITLSKKARKREEKQKTENFSGSNQTAKSRESRLLIKSTNKGLPARKYDPATDMYYRLRYDLEDYPWQYSFLYCYSDLINNTFGESKSNSSIAYKYGYGARLNYNKLAPFILDIGVYNSIFEVKTDNSYFDYQKDDMLVMQNIEAGVNFVLLPAFHGFLPYIGVGYQFSDISSGYNLMHSNDKMSVLSQKNDGALWRAGFTANLTDRFFITAEYAQTFSINKPSSYSRISGGVGFSLESDEVFKSNVKESFEDEGKLIFMGGIHQTEFQNKAFKTNNNNEILQPEIGHSLNLRILHAYPLMIDIGWFSSQFSVTENTPNWNYADTTRVKHRGGELSLNFPFMSLTRYFIPYFGAGYQYSQLYVGPAIFALEEEKNEIPVKSVDTSCGIFKAGIMICFRRLMFYGEYKHSLFNSKSEFYQLSAGVGWRIFK